MLRIQSRHVERGKVGQGFGEHAANRGATTTTEPERLITTNPLDRKLYCGVARHGLKFDISHFGPITGESDGGY